ncbi:MAG: hypothetical protein RL174_62 [Actinomycetota bacterium]|jgi:hypothetical protein
MAKFQSGAKVGAIATAGLTLMYVAILGQHGWVLVTSADPLQIAFGGLILAFPAFAIFSLVREFKFGIAIEKLGSVLEAENDWPKFNFELRPSGRPTKESARTEFEVYKAKTEADPSNWRIWFALGLTYDAAGDRARARSAMREAIRLFSCE